MKGYAIADHSESTDDERFLDRIATLSRVGVDSIQLRAKHLDDRDLLRLAGRCREHIQSPTLFFVNGRADVAVAADADGVHLPATGVPAAVVNAVSSELQLGRSCHSVQEVLDAAREGADLVLLGPVFDTRSSAKRGAVSLKDLEDASRAKIAVYALGGFDAERVTCLEGTGIEGVAAITMFMHDEPIGDIMAKVHGVQTA